MTPTSETATPAATPRKRLRTADEVATDTKNSLLDWIHETQAADRQENEKLRTQIQDLRTRLVEAEQERDEYEMDFNALKDKVTRAEKRAKFAENKIKQAEGEIAKFKEQNEALQVVLQKTRTQYEEFGKVFLGDVEISD